MPITGDDKALANLIRRYQYAGKGALRRPLLLGAQSASEALVEKEFRRSHTPNGQPWAPAVEDEGDRAHIPESLTFRVEPPRLIATSPHPGAGFFNYGSKHQESRQILPEQVLPRTWSAAYAKDGRRILADYFKPDHDSGPNADA